MRLLSNYRLVGLSNVVAHVALRFQLLAAASSTMSMFVEDKLDNLQLSLQSALSLARELNEKNNEIVIEL